MTQVLFVAPFFLETTLRFVQEVAQLPGVRTGLISQDPLERLPPGLRQRLVAHERVADGMDPRQIRDAVRRMGQPDRLLGTLEQLQVPLAQVREDLGIAGLGVEAARNFRDKSRMKDVLRAADLPCAGHVLAASVEAAQEGAARLGFPLIVKPPAGAAAQNTFRIEDAETLTEAVRRLSPTPDQPVLLEEFMTGVEHSFDAVCVGGEPRWYSISRYTPSPLEVMENPWIQWVVMLPRELDEPHHEQIRQAGSAALKALGAHTGLYHMEWFQRPQGGVAISEVGARPPGAQFTTLLSYAHDLDFYAAWARLMVHDEFHPPERRFACGAAYLRGQGRGKVRAIHGLEEAQKELGEYVVEVRLPRAGQSPASSYEGEGYVILRHPETKVVEKALAHLVRTVRVELA